MKSKYNTLTTFAIGVLFLLFSFAGEMYAQDACVTDADCDNGIFCDGTEFCLDGSCAVMDACAVAIDGCVTRGAFCDEDADICVDFADDSLCAEGEFCDVVTGNCIGLQIPCIEDADCDDGIFCNGTEYCSGGFCAAVDACAVAIDGCVTRGAFCDEDADICVDFADDSLCAEGEFCDVVTGNCVEIQTTCGMVQLIVQETVALGGPYKNHGKMVKTAAHAANP
jgi:hypothetical protein